MKSFCCNGCSFIAEQLFLAQAGSKDREALASIVNAGSDEATVVPGGGYAQVQLPIRGMVCSACALLIEHTLRKQPGVGRANVDFGAQLAYITFDQRLLTRVELQRSIERAGYDAGRVPVDERRVRRVELLRVAIAWLGMMQVMMLAVPLYFAGTGRGAGRHRAADADRQPGADAAGDPLLGAASVSRGVEPVADGVDRDGPAGRARHHRGLRRQHRSHRRGARRMSTSTR